MKFSSFTVLSNKENYLAAWEFFYLIFEHEVLKKSDLPFKIDEAKLNPFTEMLDDGHKLIDVQLEIFKSTMMFFYKYFMPFYTRHAYWSDLYWFDYTDKRNNEKINNAQQIFGVSSKNDLAIQFIELLTPEVSIVHDKFVDVVKLEIGLKEFEERDYVKKMIEERRAFLLEWDNKLRKFCLDRGIMEIDKIKKYHFYFLLFELSKDAYNEKLKDFVGSSADLISKLRSDIDAKKFDSLSLDDKIYYGILMKELRKNVTHYNADSKYLRMFLGKFPAHVIAFGIANQLFRSIDALEVAEKIGLKQIVIMVNFLYLICSNRAFKDNIEFLIIENVILDLNEILRNFSLNHLIGFEVSRDKEYNIIIKNKNNKSIKIKILIGGGNESLSLNALRKHSKEVENSLVTANYDLLLSNFKDFKKLLDMLPNQNLFDNFPKVDSREVFYDLSKSRIKDSICLSEFDLTGIDLAEINFRNILGTVLEKFDHDAVSNYNEDDFEKKGVVSIDGHMLPIEFLGNLQLRHNFCPKSLPFSLLSITRKFPGVVYPELDSLFLLRSIDLMD
jgi:hypothetical protein